MKIELTQDELASPLWLKLERTFRDQLQELRELNDSHTSTEIMTAFTRGKISICKDLIQLREDNE